jgi:hypothetical protein
MVPDGNDVLDYVVPFHTYALFYYDIIVVTLGKRVILADDLTDALTYLVPIDVEHAYELDVVQRDRYDIPDGIGQAGPDISAFAMESEAIEEAR